MSLVSPKKSEEDIVEPALRPLNFDDFTGQQQVTENLRVFVEAAKKRSEQLDHALLYGPPGLGKTTLSHIIANEMGVGFRSTSGPILTKAADLAAILTNLQPNDVLFIDEIHRLNSSVEEILYSAMEDFKLDIIIGEGPAARTVRIDLQPFTLVGATTRLGLISNPLRDRFGIPLKLDFYSYDELKKLVLRASNVLKAKITDDGAAEIAKRSRGTPRIALRLLRRIRDFADMKKSEINQKLADEALKKLEVDNQGLDVMDMKYLNFIAQNYGGDPVGVETIAAGLSEQSDTLEETIEPFLIQRGFIQRTPRGRMLTQNAFNHLGLKMPKKAAEELS
jgi:Holliday junction DNA helicase RuvB